MSSTKFLRIISWTYLLGGFFSPFSFGYFKFPSMNFIGEKTSFLRGSLNSFITSRGFGTLKVGAIASFFKGSLEDLPILGTWGGSIYLSTGFVSLAGDLFSFSLIGLEAGSSPLLSIFLILAFSTSSFLF